MFENIYYQLDFYVYIYNHTILQQAFLAYLNKNITYEDYYDNYNDTYLKLETMVYNYHIQFT